MLYHLERFLKPFKLLLTLNILETTGSDVTVQQDPNIYTNPSPTTAASLPTCQPVVTTHPVTVFTSGPALTAPEDDVRVSWVYGLPKSQLQAELMKVGMPADGNTQKLRADMVRLVRRGVVKTPTTGPEDYEPMGESGATPRDPAHSRTSLELEAANIREILGLPPDADFNDVRRLVTRTPRPATVTTASPGLPAVGLNLPTAPVMRFDYSTRPTASLPAYGPAYVPPRSQDFELPASMTSGMQHPFSSGYEQFYTPRPHAQREDPHRGLLPYLDADPDHVNRTSASFDTASLCSLVRKWNLRFDGRRDADAISFLERLHELMESYEVPPERMIKALPELLKDSALLWHRNNRDFWVRFTDFLRDFQAQYLPPGYLLHLDDEIRKRTQGDGELFRQYVVAVSTLIRRRGGFTEGEKLDRIYTNMHPSYKSYVRRRDFVNLPSLMKVAEEYEACLRERVNYRPPPSPAQALVPETAFQGRSRPTYKAPYNTSSVMKSDDERPLKGRPSGSITPRPKDSQKTTFADSTSTRFRDAQTSTDRSEPANTGGGRQGGTTFNERSQPKVCWNCDQVGHLYRDCRRPKSLKCFNCKRPGVRTTSCDCLKQGNEKRTTEQGGHRSPKPDQIHRPPTFH